MNINTIFTLQTTNRKLSQILCSVTVLLKEAALCPSQLSHSDNDSKFYLHLVAAMGGYFYSITHSSSVRIVFSCFVSLAAPSVSLIRKLRCTWCEMLIHFHPTQNECTSVLVGARQKENYDHDVHLWAKLQKISKQNVAQNRHKNVVTLILLKAIVS